MGYYSFYRIIKDIIQTIFGRKIWKVLLIILIVLVAYALFSSTFGYWDSNDSDLAVLDVVESYQSIGMYMMSRLSSSTIFDQFREYMLMTPLYLYAIPGSLDAEISEISEYFSEYFTVIFYGSNLRYSSDDYNNGVVYGYQGVNYVSMYVRYSNFSNYVFAPGCAFYVTFRYGYIYSYGVLDSGDYIQMPVLAYMHTTDNYWDWYDAFANNQEYDTSDLLAAINEVVSSVDSVDETLQEFVEDFFSDDYDEELITDKLDSISSSSDSVDDSDTSNFFSAVFNAFSNAIDEDNYSTVETITIGLPFVDSGGITLSSDLLSSILADTALATLLSSFWYFLFGMYLFKFINNLYRQLKSGDILDGYDNSDEVITSNML